MIRWTAIALALLAVLLVNPRLATAQGVLGGLTTPSRPMSYAVAELPDDYKPFRITLQGESNGFDSAFWRLALMGVPGDGPGANRMSFLTLMQFSTVAWSKGETTMSMGHEFLITYQIDSAFETLLAPPGLVGVKPRLNQVAVRVNAIQSISPLDSVTKADLLKSLTASMVAPDGNEGRAEPTTADDPSESPLDEPRPASTDTASLQNIKQAALALMMYANDFDDVMPYVQSSRSAYSIVVPYSRNSAVFFTADSPPRMFRLNMALAGVHTPQVPRPDRTVLLYDPELRRDGRRTVAMLDGSARAVDAAEWNILKQTLTATFPRKVRPLPANYFPFPLSPPAR